MLATFYDAPLSDTLMGAIKKRPVLYKGLLCKGEVGYHDFSCLAEVEAVGKALETVQAADAVLFMGFLSLLVR